MISLEKIRNRSGLLMVVIGVAMFAFIMMDLMSSQRGGGRTDLIIGEINGEEIDLQVFEVKLEERSNNNNADIEQIRNTTWNQLVRELVFQKQYEALGVSVGSEELFDMVQGADPYPSVKETFVNAEGEFDRALLLQYLKEDINNDATGQSKARWVQFEKAIAREKLQQKYNALVNKGINVSSAEAKLYYDAQNELRSVSYISIPYKSLSDSLVEVSEKELQTYLNANSDKFQQETSREIEYIVFAVKPSKEDEVAAQNWIQDIKTDFASADDSEVFIRRYSDNVAATAFARADKLPANIAADIKSAANNTVVGPYQSSFNTYELAKLIAAESRADSVQARHILISGPDASTIIDSVKTAIEKGASFATAAENISQDQGSAAKGGDLGWFAEGVMVPSFNDACFEGKVKGLQVVESQFGTHLIEVTRKSAKSKKYKVAYLSRKVVAGNETYQSVFTAAGKFAAESANADDFNQAIEEGNLSKRIADNLKENARTIAGLNNPRELIRWAYEANVGEVSDVFEMGDKFVVANLTDIKSAGTQELDEVRGQIENTLVKDKKVALLEEQLAGVTDLNFLSNDLDAVIKTVEGVSFFSSQVPGLGQEPAFVGAACALGKGELSSPIKGRNSVYLLRVDNVISSPEGVTDAVQQQLLASLQSRTSFEVFNELKKLANIKDNRATFY